MLKSENAWVRDLIVYPVLPNAQIPLALSRLNTTRHVRRVERVEMSVSNHAVRQARHSQNTWDRHVERVVSRRDVTSQVEFGLKSLRLLVKLEHLWIPAT